MRLQQGKMATLRNAFLVAIGLSFLTGQSSYGYELLGDSLNEDERDSCSNTNCLGKDPCSDDAQCSPNKCCIDVINTLTCCHESGEPDTTTPAPPITESPTTPHGGELPLCTDHYWQYCAYDGTCPCTQQSDCYQNEVCCLEINTEAPGDPDIVFRLLCYLTIPPAPTLAPGDKCPDTTPPLQCAPLHEPGSCLYETTCRANEICCTISRDEPPCCVVYPPEIFLNQTVHEQKETA